MEIFKRTFCILYFPCISCLCRSRGAVANFVASVIGILRRSATGSLTKVFLEVSTLCALNFVRHLGCAKDININGFRHNIVHITMKKILASEVFLGVEMKNTFPEE